MFRRLLIWLSAILVITGVAYTFTRLWLSPRGPFRDEGVRRQYSFLASEAIYHYETGGRQALEAYLKRVDRSDRVQHFLLDREGRDLISGKDLSELARTAATTPRWGWPPPRRFLFRRTAEGGEYQWIIQGELPFDPWSDLAAYGWIVLLVVLMIYGLAHNLARPIRQLREAVVRFGRGDLSYRTKLRRKDEIGDLAQAFDQMADRIQTLLTAERRLLQDVSHELRSPLTRLRFALHLASSSPDPKAALGRVEREVERLTTLVGELLQVTRAEGDPESRNINTVDLPEFLRRIVDDARIEAEAQEVDLQLCVPDRLTWSGDPDLLHRAIDNVLRNAIRYAPAGTAVSLNARREDGQVLVGIRDHGPGVPQEQLESIFQPFYRVEEDRGRRNGDAGVGLGLAIARRAVRAHHGEIRAQNANPGLLVEVALPC
jgi:two-component system sensor histidine kinase CpxA